MEQWFVVCDAGGVLIDDTFPCVFELLAKKHFPDNIAHVSAIHSRNKDCWGKLRADPTYTGESYWTEILQREKITQVTPSDMDAMLLESVVKYNVRCDFSSDKNQHTFDVLNDLRKKGVVTAVCSNHGVDWFEKLAAKNKIYDSFDRDLVIISQAVKCWKPQHQIFECVEKKLAEKYGNMYRRDHVVFLDDKKENVSSASKFGWIGFVYDARKESKENLLAKLTSVEKFKDVITSF